MAKATGNYQTFNLCGMLCPFKTDRRPEVFQEPGSDALSVWLFDSPDELRAMCAACGITDAIIKRVSDPDMFIEDLFRANIRIAVNPRLGPNGKTVWHELDLSHLVN